MSKKIFHLMSFGLMTLAQQGFNGAVIGMDEEGFKKANSHLAQHRKYVLHAQEGKVEHQKNEKGIQEFVLIPTDRTCYFLGLDDQEPKNCENRKEFKKIGLYEETNHTDPYPPRLIEKILVEEEGTVIYMPEECPACLKAYDYVYNYRKNAREKEKKEFEIFKSSVQFLQQENKSLKENQEVIKKEFEIFKSQDFIKLNSQVQLLQQESNNTKETAKIELEKITSQIQLFQKESNDLKENQEKTKKELETFKSEAFEKLNSQVLLLQKDMKEVQEKNNFNFDFPPMSNIQSMTQTVEELYRVTVSITQQLSELNKKQN